MPQGTSHSKGSAKSRSGSARKSTGASRSSAAPSRRAQSQSRASSSRGRSAATRGRTNANRSSNGKGAVESVKDTVGGGAKSAKDAVKDTVGGGAKSAKESITNGVQSTGDAVTTAAKKAKGPALAGGAALAGLAGGLAIASRAGGPRRVLGVPVPGTRRSLVKINTPRRVKARSTSKDLLKAAGEVGSAGRQVGELVTEVQRVRTELDRGRRRSPVEVVLEGLTSRRVRG
jgi:hypothetical protein